MNELIIQKLIENVQFFDEKLVESVNDCSHYSYAMCLDGVEHLVHSNRFDLFCFRGDFNEHLGVDVVATLRDELAQVTKELKDIDSLL